MREYSDRVLPRCMRSNFWMVPTRPKDEGFIGKAEEF